MNRTAIKNFAVWARKSLRDEVATNAARLGVTRTRVTEPQYVAGGMVIGATTFDQPTTTLYRALRDDLNVRLKSKPLELVVDELVDEMAYTWFNRLAALRFMEVKGYIGRALSSSVPGTVEPDLLRDALSLADTLPGLDAERIDALQAEGDEPLYRALLVAQCKDLAGALPDLFGRTAYAELFLPVRLLTQGSFVQRLVQDIPASDWEDIEIVGWLYQFYISERKDEVFALKKAYEAHDIPAATQLFTPHWIVRYMVENSLGRLWLEAHPESNLRAQMPYYLESQGENEQRTPKPQVDLKPEDLTVLDPACGSGHILVYAFDLLFAIYQEQGYPERTIPELILTHNLHGLDIDERAAQLASFALMMKARERSRRILRNPPVLHVRHTAPTKGWRLPDVPELNKADWQPLLDAFKDADNLGSLITPPEVDEDRLEAQLGAYEASGRLEASAYAPQLRQVVEQARLLRRQYRAVVANPPYMGGKAFNKVVKDFVTVKYPRSKSDLFAVFMERALELTASKGLMGMVNQHAWMFLSSYEGLREHLLENYNLQTMIHLGPRAFPEVGGEVVQATAFTIAKQPPQRTPSTFVRLVDLNSSAKKEEALLGGLQRYVRDNQQDFEKIPGSPIAYWVSERMLEAFSSNPKISEKANPKQGLATANNDRFLRSWYEVAFTKLAIGCSDSKEAEETRLKWFPHNKGGEYRRWYGNMDWIINWENDGREIKQFPKAFIRNPESFFKSGITWSAISSGSFAARKQPSGVIFSNAGMTVYGDDEVLAQTNGLLNSIIGRKCLEILAPTLNYGAGEVGRVPIYLHQTADMATKQIDLT